MIELVLLTILVPVADQALKRWVQRRVGEGAFSLGLLGKVRVVSTQVWALRAVRGSSVRLLWSALALTGVGTAVVAVLMPGMGWAFGLLLGGALSHTIETSRRGSICDYVCLRFWPPFNLADVALTAGALGVPFALIAAMP